MLHATFRHGQAALPQVLLSCLCALLLCAAPATAQAQGVDERQAETLAAAGRHLEAANRYEQAARHGLLSWDARLALLAAREYLAAGERDEARRLADKARSRVRGEEERALLALVDGSLALDAGNATAAVAALRAAPTDVPDALTADVLAVRGRAELAAGQSLAGVRTYEARGALLTDDAARAANDRLLLDQLLLHPPAAVSAVPGLSERERGWLELPAVLAVAGGGATDDPLVARRVRAWLEQHPGHPGAAFVPRTAVTAVTRPAGPDAAIALLLPLTGKQHAAAQAVRDGFAAAWFAAGNGDVRPRIEIHDTATSAGAAYARAVANGARVVVGPLLKEDVLAVLAANASGLPVPTLALNSAVGDGAVAPPFLYQFSLDPEQEARAVARRIADDGLVRGIALFPEGTWGQRLHAAFLDELQRTGTVALMTPAQYYAPGAKDFSGPLRAALGRYGGAGERGPAGKPAPVRDGAAERATGPQFAFVAATPQTARAIRPQLRFQMAYDLPVYATSDAWEPSVRAAADMEGMVFPEMPWLLYAGQGAPELWDALRDEWQARARGRLRLYAFGHDAFRLARQLGSGSGSGIVGVEGLTGTLAILPETSQVERRLPFARIEGGRPVPATAGVAPILREPAANRADVSPAE